MPRMIAFLFRHKLIVLLTLTVIIRLAALVALPQYFAFEQTGVIHGSDAYDRYATGLLTTGIYGTTAGVPDANVAPLYGVIVAAVYSAIGRGGLQIALIHIALDCITVAALFFIGKRLFARWGESRAETVGWLAGLFTAIYPYLIFQNLTLIDTPLFMALFYCWLLMMIALRERARLDAGTLALALGAGLLLGLATMTRAITPPLALLVGLWFLFRLNIGQAFARLLPVAGVSLLVLLPWMARNYAVFNQFVPMSVTFGANLYQGNNADVLPFLRAGYDPQWTGDPVEGYAPNDPAADRVRVQRALDFWRNNSDILPALFWEKFITHWSIEIFPRYNPTEGAVDPSQYQGDVSRTGEDGALALSGLPQGDPVAAYSSGLFDTLARPIHALYFGSLLLLALAGVVLTARGWRDVSLIWLVQIGMTLTYVIFHPSTRYRVPSDPLLFLFSAFALAWGWLKIVQWLRKV
jgi:hypothetical protein